MNTEQLTRMLLEKEQVCNEKGLSTVQTDSILLPFLMENAPIVWLPDNIFFGKLETEYLMAKVESQRYARFCPTTPYQPGEDALFYTGDKDYGHTCPDWEAIMRLGLPGLLQRVRSAHPADPQATEFLAAAESCWQAAIDLAERAAQAARQAGFLPMAEGLHALANRAPATLFEAMQLTLFYYNLQQRVEGTYLRTLGRLDRLYQPFLEADLAAGRLNMLSAAELVDAFIRGVDSYHIGANLPFALAGTKDGKPYCNTLTELVLQSFRRICPPDTKIHFLYHPRLPQTVVRLALECLRDGANSIVFMNDAAVKEALLALGEKSENVENYTVVGCYECGGYGEVTCSCNARVNLVRAVELAMNRGRALDTGEAIGLPCEDAADYPAFELEVYRQLGQLAHGAMALTHADETAYPQTHTAPLFSSTFAYTLAKGRDVYQAAGAEYNSSSLNGLGVATAADAMAAVKILVYDRKTLTLPQFADILRNDWADQELLRRQIQNRFPRFGMEDIATDTIGTGLVHALAGFVNGQPNARGGFWRTGIFSIDWRIWFGKATPASADGRKAGEPLSKNTTASLGGDREGVLGLIGSACKIDPKDIPNGGVLDVVLSHTATTGENGMQLLQTTLQSFMQRGGFAIQYNILSAEKLRDAQQHPEKYPNLQVRLCGWNVRFADLAPVEQENFIRRAEAAQ